MKLMSEQMKFTLWNTIFSPLCMAFIWAFFPVLSSHDLWELAGKQVDYWTFLQTIAINALYRFPRYVIICYAAMILPVAITSFLLSFCYNGHPTELTQKKGLHILIFLVLTFIYGGLGLLIAAFFKLHYVESGHLAFGFGFGASFSYMIVLYIMARKIKNNTVPNS